MYFYRCWIFSEAMKPWCHYDVFDNIKRFRCCHCYSFVCLWWLPFNYSQSHFYSFLLSQQLIFTHLTVFLSFPVGQLPPIVTRVVCAGGVSTVLCGRSSSITLASCLAWIGIWFHFSIISGPPSSAHFASYQTSSCKISLCTQTRLQPSMDNARARTGASLVF